MFISGPDRAVRLARAGRHQPGRLGLDDLGELAWRWASPWRFTAKYWLTPCRLAVDGTMGYHFNSNFDFHGDYLWHSFSSFNISSGRLPFYVGLGGHAYLGDSVAVRPAFPVGAPRTFSPLRPV